MSPRNILLNAPEGRLRSGWRIAIFLPLFALVSRILTKINFAVLGRPDPDTLDWWVQRGVLVVLAATLAVWIARRFVDRRSFASLGLRLNGRAGLDVVAGLAISGLMVAVVIAVLVGLGMADVTMGAGSEGVGRRLLRLPLWFFGIGIAVAWSEELALRGYLLQNLREGIGLAGAVVVSCLVYGLVHMANPNATILSGVLIAALGYLRVLGWLRTGQLWLSMGMHAGWDFFQGPVVGMSVSGMATDGVMRTTVTGPDWLSGGAFGPEAGILTLAAFVVGGVCMHLWTRRCEGTPWTTQRAGTQRGPLVPATPIPVPEPS